MAFKYNPLSGQIEDQQQGPQGPAGTMTSSAGGTEGTPGFNFSGDSDTGIYSAGVNKLGIATGGGGRLFIDANGRVGINKETPGASLVVHDTTPVLSIERKYGSSTSDVGAITFGNENHDSNVAQIRVVPQGSVLSGQFAFETQNGGLTTERFRIGGDGHVGIGTSSNRLINAHLPRLQVSGTSYSTSTVSLVNNAADATGAYLFFTKQKSGSAGGSTAVAQDDIIGDIRFTAGDGNDVETGAARITVAAESNASSNNVPACIKISTTASTAPEERIRINSTGAVGIGTVPAATSSNTKRLALGAKGNIWGRTSGNVDGALTIADNYYVNSSGTNKIIEAGDAAYLNLRAGSLRFGTTDTTYSAGATVGLSEKFRIENDGKVGIGTSAPDSLLHIKNGGSNPTASIKLESLGTNPNLGDTLGKIEFEHNKTGAAGIATEILSVVDANGTGAAGFQFKTGTGGAATTKLTIDSSGNVGINGATSTGRRGRLDVRSSGDTASTLTAVFGANEGQAGGALSDNHDKAARVGLYHYDRDEEAYALFSSGGTSTANAINFGGGTSLMNAATEIGFYTAANTTTPTGSKKFEITSDGQLNARGATDVRLTLGSTGVAGSNNSVYVGANGGDLKFNAALSGNTYFTSGITSTVSILNDGKVGIGTATPTGTLEIKSTTDNDKMLRFDMERSWSFLKEGTAANTRLELNAESGGKWFDITNENRYKTASFFTNYNNSEIHLCPDGGNVGIGTNSPSAKLYVNGTQNGLQARFGGAGTGLGISLGQKTNPNALVTFQAQDSTYGTFRFVKGTSDEQLRIDADGNVGIGTATPSHKLSIVGGSSSQLQVKGGEADLWLTSTGSGSEKSWRIFGSTGGSTHKFRIYDGVNDREPFSIDNAGDVAFSDNVTLASDKYLKFNGSAFTIRGNQGNNFINSQTGSLYIQAGGNTAIEVKDNKNVSINGAVTTKPLAVKGSSGDILSLSSAATESGASDTGPSIEFLGSNGSSHGVGFGYIHTKKENGDSGNNATYMRFDTRAAGGSAAEALRLKSDKTAIFAGWVYGDRFINSTTSEDPWLKGVNASGTETSYIKKDGTAYFAGNIKMAADKGIQFSPYDETVSSPGSDSNTLDDYEEGTFTPTYKTGAAATNTLSAAGYTTTIGLYTKIGDIVHFQLRLKCSSATAESGQIVIEGLPEAQISTNAQSGAYIVASEMLSASNNARLIIDGSSIIFQNLAGAALNSDTANLDFTKEFHCAGFYKTA